MQYQSIRVVRPGQFDSATAQTPGSLGLAAVHPGAGIDSPIWGGVFRVEPAARTAIHHHGEQHTIAYVLSGSSYVRWGKHGEFDATCTRVISCMFRRGFPTRKSILRATFPCNGFVVRSTSEPIVLDLPNTFRNEVPGFRAIPMTPRSFRGAFFAEEHLDLAA
jgi:uncharacterized RmlC-like cupin family protein